LPFQDATAIPVELKSPWYNKDQWVMPSVSASAARGTDGLVRVALTNVDPNRSASVTTTLSGVAASAVEGEILTGAIDAHNTFDRPDAVKPVAFTGASVSGSTLNVTLPPASVVVLTLR
ncbi:alpha-L-arabinofuranosidase C-terminal domain-containing protein, partial [Sphingomonas sp. Leaf33]|uniref:alpha-L-arabinofuranosidase C-terminal domain-containing protein n=1 Tax=Sphingomonas sp. Leaf33 TaxID=1736215 RepID=UPI002AA2A486